MNRLKTMDGFLENLPEIFEGDRRSRKHRVKSKLRIQNVKPQIKVQKSTAGPAHYPAVIYHVIKCTKCGSEKTKVITTKRLIRYHRCSGYWRMFKSVER